MHGVRDSTTNPACGTIWSVSGQASSLVGYTIQANDTASFDHLESRIPVDVAILFTDGSFVQTERAADGSWHHDSIDLSGSIHKMVYLVAMGPGDPYNAQGTWDSYVRNAVLASADGTVHPIFTGGPASGYNWNGCGSNNLAFEVVPIALGNTFATNFYVGDHLGSAQMEFSASGAPLSTSQFMPFGGEINPPVTSNHFKFTGKERDTESGLDYFGARYYASSMGRMMSPDPTFLNIRRLFNPQRWNMYSYAINNPLTNVDPDGQEVISVVYPHYPIAVSDRGGVHVKVNAGHGGVVFVAKDGTTHYFEYGRYAGPKGEVRNAGAAAAATPSVQRDAAGNITQDSMTALLSTLSASSGKGGQAEALVIQTTTAEDESIMAYLQARQAQNSDPNRPPYTLFGGHNCGTLACETMDHAGMHTVPQIARTGLSPYNMWLSLWRYNPSAVGWSYEPKEHVSHKLIFNP